MKKLLFTQILFASTIMLLVSCTGDTPKPSPINKNVYVVSPEDTISNAKFDTWKQDWITDGSSFLSANGNVEYFDMPLVDLSETVGEHPNKARFYFGLDKSIFPAEAHLIVVGVNSKGIDLLDNSIGQFAYDLSQPCPKYCNPPRH